jgi:hypothetical protein
MAMIHRVMESPNSAININGGHFVEPKPEQQDAAAQALSYKSFS